MTKKAPKFSLFFSASLIISSLLVDADLPAVALEGVGTGREGLWSKTVAAFKYVEENFRNEYDWVMKADDDT